MSKQSKVLSLIKAFTMLNCLKEADRPLSLRELSKITNYPKSTLHSMLSTLRDFRVIAQDEDGSYRLGSHLFELGSAVEKQWNIVEISKPFMQNVCSKINESVGIATIDDGCALVLNSIVSTNPLRIITDTGTRLPLHATALGKALISEYDDAQIEELFGTNILHAYTPHTITRVDELLEECKRVRENGYAVENGEMRIGMRAVASPIYDINKKIKYAISVTGMFRQISDYAFSEAKENIIEAAKLISKRLQ